MIPPPPTSMLPMPELIYSAIFLTFATAWWMARRTARVWAAARGPSDLSDPATEPSHDLSDLATTEGGNRR